MSVDDYIHDVKRKLLQLGSKYLYQIPFPTKPKIIIIHCNDYSSAICSDGKEHSFTLEEKRYGKAMMILKICKVCIYGENEVIPPKENRMVIQ